MKLLSKFYSVIKFLRKLKMDLIDISSPSKVRNMTVLDKTAFIKVVKVPSIIIDKENIDIILKKIKSKHLLKIYKYNPVITPEHNNNIRQILLNPGTIKSEKDIDNFLGVSFNTKIWKYTVKDITLNYDNWKADEILSAVLPEGNDGSSGYSVIGHILHLNLREHLYPYKKLIGQVYLDKVPFASMVVNKVDIVDKSDNVFRTFLMEKLAGETDDTITTVKHCKCIYTFDFSKVYWNPRLGGEHERIINKLNSGDILFDVMAGVGPFAIPIAKKRCYVYANDLNPASFEALKQNCEKNKVNKSIECFNMDGNEFIKSVFRDKLSESINEGFTHNIHITMNLPAIAIDFLPSFIGLYNSDNIPKFTKNESVLNLPIVHVYLFSFNETKDFAVHCVASKLGYCLKKLEFCNSKDIDVNQVKKNIQPSFWDHILEVHNVRNVSPAKIMFRVSFYLPLETLRKNSSLEVEMPNKKIKL